MPTQNKMLFTGRQIATIVTPLILQSLLSIAIGMIDSIMVSNKGQDAFAGVSLVGSLDVLLITLFSSLNAGGAVVLAQTMGRGDQKRTCEVAKQLCYVSAIVATAISIVVLILRGSILTILFGEAEEAVMQNALSYFTIIALSFPFLAIENSVAAIFRTQGDTMISLKISVFMNLLNICGNAFFIYGLDLGATGAAIATLISRIVGAVSVTFIAHNKKRYIYLEKFFHYRPNFSIIKEILRIGIPSAIENSMFQLGKIILLSMISGFGTAAIAANAVGNAVSMVACIPGMAMGLGIVAVISQCVGAGDYVQAEYYKRKVSRIIHITNACFSAAVIALMPLLMKLYDLSAQATHYVWIIVLAHGILVSLFWNSGYVLPVVFRSAGDANFPMVISISSMLLVLISSIAFIAKSRAFDLYSISLLLLLKLKTKVPINAINIVITTTEIAISTPVYPF